MENKTGVGQDSHRFLDEAGKVLILGGVEFSEACGLRGNSDADVVLHALINAISSITGVVILGKVADAMCERGIVDSAEYLKVALVDLGAWQVRHIAISIECKMPKITPKIDLMRQNIADLVGVEIGDIGITATSGEGLSAYGRGEGIAAFCIITVGKND